MEYGQHGPRGRLVPSFVAEALVTGPGIATILHRLGHDCLGENEQTQICNNNPCSVQSKCMITTN